MVAPLILIQKIALFYTRDNLRKYFRSIMTIFTKLVTTFEVINS